MSPYCVDGWMHGESPIYSFWIIKETIESRNESRQFCISWLRECDACRDIINSIYLIKTREWMACCGAVCAEELVNCGLTSILEWAHNDIGSSHDWLAETNAKPITHFTLCIPSCRINTSNCKNYANIWLGGLINISEPLCRVLAWKLVRGSGWLHQNCSLCRWSGE